MIGTFLQLGLCLAEYDKDVPVPCGQLVVAQTPVECFTLTKTAKWQGAYKMVQFGLTLNKMRKIVVICEYDIYIFICKIYFKYTLYF